MQTHNNIPLYTPSILAPETLQAMFVKRDALLASLNKKHKSSVLEPSKHFSLIVGPRGMGKTHLISMLYHQLNQDSELKDAMLLVWLREEEWGISSYLDLLMQILRNIKDSHNTINSSINDTIIDALYEQNLTDAEYQVEILIESLLTDKVLVLLAENLNLIFDGLGTDGQEKLRAFIQNTGKVSIVAATQSLFSSVTSRSKPFYGFFTVTHLEKFALEDAIQLLINIAKRDNNQALVEALNTDEGQSRIRALHHLAGGSPRIYVLFSQFIQADTLEEFTEPMMKMLDELTPYYQAKMLDLSVQQRKLIMFLYRESGAVTVQALAKKNHISPQTASSQLKKLKAAGFVESTQYGRQSYYEIAEPLLRMVMSVKDHRGASIKLAVDLIRHFYTTTELKQIQSNEKIDLLDIKFLSKDLIHSAINEPSTSPHVTAAIKDFEREFKKENYQETQKIIENFYQFNQYEIDIFEKAFRNLIFKLFDSKTVQFSMLEKLFFSLTDKNELRIHLILSFLRILKKKKKTVSSKNLTQALEKPIELVSCCLVDIDLTLSTVRFSSKQQDPLIAHIIEHSSSTIYIKHNGQVVIESLIKLIEGSSQHYYFGLLVARIFVFYKRHSQEEIERTINTLVASQLYTSKHMEIFILFCAVYSAKPLFKAITPYFHEVETYQYLAKEFEAASSYIETQDPNHLLVFPKEIRNLILKSQDELNDLENRKFSE